MLSLDVCVNEQVEIVIKENNMLDALGMLEDYCCLLIERVALLQMNK